MAEVCYCDPTILSYGCNEQGCIAIAIIFLVLFSVPLMVCIYRFFFLFKKPKDNLWSIVSHSFIAITCICRIVRSGCLIARITDLAGMALLYLFPIGFLICSYFNTLYVWIKIIYHVNFSKVVEKIFPSLGKTMIALQVLLIISIIIVSLVQSPYQVTNGVLGAFIFFGALGFAIFGKMIWREYRDISSKDCGVFSQTTHSKIQKVTKLSAAAITVTFFTFCVIIWGLVSSYPMDIKSLIGFLLVGRGIEVSWIVSMLLVLSPSLQTWGAGASKQVSSLGANQHFEDLSDSSIDIEDGEVTSSKKLQQQQQQSAASINANQTLHGIDDSDDDSSIEVAPNNNNNNNISNLNTNNNNNTNSDNNNNNTNNAQPPQQQPSSLSSSSSSSLSVPATSEIGGSSAV